MNAGTMAHATYVHVATLSALSGIETRFLGGTGLDLSAASNNRSDISASNIGHARAIKASRKNDSPERAIEA
jgi:hypothetical protein